MPVMRFNNDPTAIVYIPDGDDLSVRINVLNVPSNKHGSGSIEFLDMNGDQLDNFMFSNENRNWNSITFTAPEGNKFYKLKFSNPSSWMSIQGPNRPFAFMDPLDTGVMKKPLKIWTYVPNHIGLDMSFKYLTRNIIIRNNGVKVDGFYVDEPILKHISGDGIYSFETTKASFRVLNTPHLFSLTKEQTIYPQFE